MKKLCGMNPISRWTEYKLKNSSQKPPSKANFLFAVVNDLNARWFFYLCPFSRYLFNEISYGIQTNNFWLDSSVDS